ncbi:hypothetical protein [Novilysobacter erysipheiresistens]|uniref:Uncharacterized protein n=1 Tax=Novilysobacter erysipheiresistens TaxID=1749332 RepID=A0ABU7YZI5_9GAMM
MTQRNNFPQTNQATPAGVSVSLRVALDLAPVVASVLVLITLITVQLGAGFGYV